MGASRRFSTGSISCSSFARVTFFSGCTGCPDFWAMNGKLIVVSVSLVNSIFAFSPASRSRCIACLSLVVSTQRSARNYKVCLWLLSLSMSCMLDGLHTQCGWKSFRSSVTLSPGPCCRVICITLRSGSRTAGRFAVPPRRIPSFVKATPDGNIFPPYALPSALGMIRGVPPSMYAASELVVPRSIPIILAICFTSVLDDDDLSGTQDAIVEPIALPHDRLHDAVFQLGIGHLLDAIHLVRVEDPPLRGNLLQADFLEGLS